MSKTEKKPAAKKPAAKKAAAPAKKPAAKKAAAPKAEKEKKAPAAKKAPAKKKAAATEPEGGWAIKDHRSIMAAISSGSGDGRFAAFRASGSQEDADAIVAAVAKALTALVKGAKKPKAKK